MGGSGLVLVVAAALALAGARPAAAVVLGGGPVASDCYVTFEGVTSADGRTVECADGAACDSDAAIDGRCTFAVTVCVKQPAEGCNAAVTVTRLKGAKRFLPNRPPLPATEPACGVPNPVVVQLKSDGRRPGKRTIRTVAVTDGNPRKDADQFTLRCVPATP